MRLVFFYVSSAHGFGLDIPWIPEDCSGNYWIKRVQEEGYFELIRLMVQEEIIDSASIVVESREHIGQCVLAEKITAFVVPDIRYMAGLYEDDVIWIRGGWKHWHDWIEARGKAGHWLILYAANTGRQRWKFWDVVLDDLGGKDQVDKVGRVHLDFRKPINENVFKPMDLLPVYDVCIGASRIHDKKGQWRGIDALIEYQKIFDRDLYAVLPGPFHHGIETNKIRRKIKEFALAVDVTDGVSREKINELLNRSRLFLALGSHGQGDRGPIESMRVGTPVLVGFPRYHAPWLTAHNMAAEICEDPQDPKKTARQIHDFLKRTNGERRRFVFNYHKRQAGLREVCLPGMKRLFDFIREHSKEERAKLIEV